MTLIIQLPVLLIGLALIYWGGRSIYSRKYYMEKVRKRDNPLGNEKYEDVDESTRLYERYGWGGRWLLLGLGLVGLAIYSFFKL